MADWISEDFIQQSNSYTKESILHICCFQGHLDLIEDLLMKNKNLVKLKDIHENTAFHSLCKNSASQDSELITIFQHLKQYKIPLEKKNEDNETGIDLLIKRIKDKNPYDDNLQSIRLLYWNILDSISQDYYNKLKVGLNFIPKDKILQSNFDDNSSQHSSRSRDNSIKKRASIKKMRTTR